MSLAVFILPEVKPPLVGQGHELALEFSNDGYWCFLYPLLQELGKKTNQLIQLYEDAAFSGHMLDTMQDTIADARVLVSQQPDQWEEHIGTQLTPIRQELYETLYKKEFEVLLDQWEKAVITARQRNHYLTFWGD